VPDPTISDVLTSIERLRVETQTRVEALAHESRSRDTAQTERSVRLEAKLESSVGTLTNGLTILNEELGKVKLVLPAVEKAASAAKLEAEKATTSHYMLQGETQEQWRIVTERLDKLGSDLLEADKVRVEELARRDAAKEAQFKEASLAAARVAEAHKQAIENRRIWVPAAQAILITVITGVVTVLSVRASHQDTNARLDAMRYSIAAARATDPYPGPPPGFSLESVLAQPAAPVSTVQAASAPARVAK
jgi:hypothetical protein